MSVRAAMIVLLPLIVSITQVLAASDVEQSLMADIKKAEQHLNKTQHRVGDTRREIAERLNVLEQTVLGLREKTAVARRLTDEKTLNLSQLEKRLDSWRQQHTHQQNLLTRFMRQHDVPIDVDDDQSLQAQLTAIAQLTDSLNARLYPAWQNKDVVISSGEIKTMQALTIGPISWYWYANKSEAGFATLDNGIVKTGLALSDSDRRGLEQLEEKGAGTITFDPSLNRAIVKAEQTESAVEHIAKGGLWAIPIILFALFAISIAILKSVQLWRLPKVTMLSPTQLQAMMQTSQILPDKIAGMQRRLLQIAFNCEKGQQRDDQLFTELQTDKCWLERWIGAIAITASISPLLGLLGTVSGMIETFKMMNLFGSGDPEIVSGGIAQALVTTELGLVVAIPALIVNAVLSRRAKSYYTELETFAVQLSQLDALNITPLVSGRHAICTQEIGVPA